MTRLGTRLWLLGLAQAEPSPIPLPAKAQHSLAGASQDKQGNYTPYQYVWVRQGQTLITDAGSFRQWQLFEQRGGWTRLGLTYVGGDEHPWPDPAHQKELGVMRLPAGVWGPLDLRQ